MTDGWTPPDKPIEIGATPATGWSPPDKPIGEPSPKPADEGFTLFGTKPHDPVFGSVVAPVLNTIDYPVRAGAADFLATMPGMAAFASHPGSPDQWQDIRDKIIRATEIPETGLGKAISQIASIPGALVSGGVRSGSEALLGKRATEALTPLGETIGDVLPFGSAALKAARGVRTPDPMTPRPAVPAAGGAGYRLAPEEITESPGVAGRVLSAASGKIKKFQELSYENQRNTNRLAATAIGLPADAQLNEAAFDRARQPAIQAYRDIEAAAPSTVLGADPAFRREVNAVTAQRGILEPSATENPGISHLREQLLSKTAESTNDVRETIADLRFKAGQNFRKQGDAAAHDLAMAQRRAAGVLENAVERSITYGPDHIKALTEYDAAARELQRYREMAAGRARGAPVDVPAVTAELARAQGEVVRTAVPTQAAQMLAADTLNKFRNARALFARISDLELATNLADGNVSARRVSALRSGSMKRPLTTEMKQIADAYDAFPRSMQDPARTGYPEEWSILDAYGTGASLVAGHPLAAAAIASRQPLRRALVSERFQRWLQDRYRRQVNPTAPVTPPAASGYLWGTGLQPHDPSQWYTPPALLP